MYQTNRSRRNGFVPQIHLHWIGRARHRQVAVVWVVAVAFLLMTHVAHANRPGFTVLDHVIDEEAFQVLVERLSLSDMQRKAVEGHFDRYVKEVRSLDDTAASDLKAHIAWAKSNKPAGDDNDSAEALKVDVEFSLRLRQTQSESNLAADLLLHEFYAEVYEILAESQREKLPEVQRRILRMNTIGGEKPKNLRAFGSCIDLVNVVEISAEDSGPLATIMGNALALVSEDLKSARNAIDQAIVDYELQMDVILQANLAKRRKVEKPDPERLEYEPGSAMDRERAVAWCEQFMITNRTASRIADALKSALGNESCRAWESIYWEAWNPILVNPLPFDGAEQWVEWKSPTLSDQQVAAIDELFDEYKDTIHKRRKAIFDAAARVNCNTASLLGNDELHVVYAKAIRVLLDEHQGFIDRFAALLDEQDAMAVRTRFALDAFEQQEWCSNITWEAQVAAGLAKAEDRIPYIYDPQTGEYRPVHETER